MATSKRNFKFKLSRNSKKAGDLAAISNLPVLPPWKPQPSQNVKSGQVSLRSWLQPSQREQKPAPTVNPAPVKSSFSSPVTTNKPIANVPPFTPVVSKPSILSSKNATRQKPIPGTATMFGAATVPDDDDDDFDFSDQPSAKREPFAFKTKRPSKSPVIPVIGDVVDLTANPSPPEGAGITNVETEHQEGDIEAEEFVPRRKRRNTGKRSLALEDDDSDHDWADENCIPPTLFTDEVHSSQESNPVQIIPETCHWQDNDPPDFLDYEDERMDEIFEPSLTPPPPLTNTNMQIDIDPSPPSSPVIDSQKRKRKSVVVMEGAVAKMDMDRVPTDELLEQLNKHPALSRLPAQSTAAELRDRMASIRNLLFTAMEEICERLDVAAKRKKTDLLENGSDMRKLLTFRKKVLAKRKQVESKLRSFGEGQTSATGVNGLVKSTRGRLETADIDPVRGIPGLNHPQGSFNFDDPPDLGDLSPPIDISLPMMRGPGRTAAYDGDLSSLTKGSKNGPTPQTTLQFGSKSSNLKQPSTMYDQSGGGEGFFDDQNYEDPQSGPTRPPGMMSVNKKNSLFANQSLAGDVLMDPDGFQAPQPILGSFKTPVGTCGPSARIDTPSPSQFSKQASQARPAFTSPPSKFSGFSFDHSKELLKVFRKTFGLHEFRKNQLEAINATLLGEDCFVLMPTGGGKSLTYQLPGVLTEGVTFVVSPLRSLIQDQVQKLVSLEIPAVHLSGDVDQGMAASIYGQLSCRDPVIKLLYVTPEKISASPKLISVMEHLYNRKMLARFVIDEAHCVSQWGHDFRPDYKRLCRLREKFPGVPFMALTATATPRVRKDILHQLGMTHPQTFTSSFDRSNLRFEVREKRPSKLVGEIAELIRKHYRNASGIVYCFSRKECETTAKELQVKGIRASAYHAGQSDKERVLVQRMWLNDEYQVVCATIAFGMGIDKANVRFVFHFSIPKSMEGYYQEAGRAGRDGEPAQCIIFYSYKDVTRLRRMVEKEPGNYAAKKVHIDNLYRLVQFCENVADCRRLQLLQYFGEMGYDPENCQRNPLTVCSNCSSNKTFTTVDMTAEAKEIVKFIKQVTGGPSTGGGRRAKRWGTQFTLNYFIDVFMGSTSAKVTQSGHNSSPVYGLLKKKKFQRADCERLLRKMVIDGVLQEDLHIGVHDQAISYATTGPKGIEVVNGRKTVELRVTEGRAAAAELSAPQKKEDEVRTALLTELRATCRKMANSMGINPVGIFSDDTLREMAANPPYAMEDLLEITGVTELKARRFGQTFLEVIYKFLPQLIPDDDETFTEDIEEDVSSSHYFNDRGSSSARKNTRGKRKRGASSNRKPKRARVQGGRKPRQRGKKATATSSNNTWVSKASAAGASGAAGSGSNMQRFQFKKTGGAVGGGGGGGGRGLGMMPDPKPKTARSFLTGNGQGQFMG